MAERPRASFYTLGCKLNQYEIEAIRERFERAGYEIVPFGKRADVSVINTCTVTGKSDYQSRQILRRAGRASPDGLIVATGCYAQLAPVEISSLPEVDLIVGTNLKGKIVDLVRATQKGQRSVLVENDFDYQSFEDMDITTFWGRTRAFIKIQDGCNQRCSYCVVPMARGPSRSRSLESLVSQVKRLVDAGFREVVLSGVQLGAYGRDLPEQISLLDAIKAVENIDGLERFRLSSLEPKEINGEMLDLLTNSEKFSRHLHLSLQSGDDDLLRRMRRRYRSADFEELVWGLKERIPQIGLGADVIAGFPGEEEESFQNTYRFIARLPLSYLHVFPFSPRKGTDAAKLENHIDPKTKEERCAQLRMLGLSKSRAFKETFLGREMRVLVEHRRDRETGLLTGLTDNYIRVLIDGPDKLMNRLVRVRLEELKDQNMFGIALSDT